MAPFSFATRRYTDSGAHDSPVKRGIQNWHPGRLALLVAAAVGMLVPLGRALHWSLEHKSIVVPHELLGWIAGISILVILAALGVFIWHWLPSEAGSPVEGPDRMYLFRQATETLDWDPLTREQSLRKLALGVVDLALAEVVFYYRRRRTSRIVSHTLRLLAWVLGTAGILQPLVSAALYPDSPLSSWGYVFIAGSASMLAANSVFDGTHAHVRATKAQLSLEHLITDFVLTWNRILAADRDFATSVPEQPTEVHPRIEAAFTELLTFARAIAAVVNEETGAWATGVVASLDEIRAGVGPLGTSKGNSGSKPPQSASTTESGPL